MLSKISTILECSRVFSLPMTIFSWLVIFTYSVINGGNILYGFIALAGICFAHMGTNVLDDYLDYKYMIKQVDFNKEEYLKSTQKTKCRYIISGMMREKDVLELALIYMLLAALIGLFFFLKCGLPVIYFGLAGGVITFLYSIMSKIRLSEVGVALAYGPLLYGGVDYVMTKTLSWEVLILSLPTMFMTVILLYIHTVMDYDFDINEGHKTVANSFDSQLDSLIVLKIFLILAYITPIFLCVFDICDWQIFLTYLTLPLAFDMFKSMEDYSLDSSSVPTKKWFHYPMENMKRIKRQGAESFMIRMYQSRNLMMYFSLFIVIALILSTL